MFKMNNIGYVSFFDNKLEKKGEHSFIKFQLSTKTKRTTKGLDGLDKPVFTSINCEVWRKNAEIISQYVKDGDRLYVEGNYTNDEYITKDGAKAKFVKLTVTTFEFISNQQEAPKEKTVPTKQNVDW